MAGAGVNVREERGILCGRPRILKHRDILVVAVASPSDCSALFLRTQMIVMLRYADNSYTDDNDADDDYPDDGQTDAS